MLETRLSLYEEVFTELYTLNSDNESRGMIKNFFFKINKILPCGVIFLNLENFQSCENIYVGGNPITICMIMQVD